MFGSPETSSNSTNAAPPGYPRLAERMSVIPEQAVFRRFGALNAQRLLFLQAELIHFEIKLSKQQFSDKTDPQSNRGKNARSWYTLSHQKDTADGEQWKLVQIIMQKLKEYSKSFSAVLYCFRLSILN